MAIQTNLSLATTVKTAFSRLDSSEQQFIKDVVADMIYDGKGINIKMKGAANINAIAEAMAICILDSNRKNEEHE